MPCAAVAHESVHSVAHLLEHVFGACRLVAASDSRGDIRVESRACLRHGVVACYDLIGLQSLGQLAVDVRLGSQNVREAHHLAEAHDAVPCHHLADLFRAYVRACVLESGNGRNARRYIRHRLERSSLRIVDHGLYALRSAYVADLVRIHEYACGAVRDYCAGVLSDAYHGRLHVDVSVHESRSYILAGCIYYFCVFTNAVSRVTYKSDAAFSDRHIDALLYLGCAYIYQLGVFYDHVRLLDAHRHIRHRSCYFI